MPEFSDKDIEQSRALLAFLKSSFMGASFGPLKVDEAVAATERVLEVAEWYQPGSHTRVMC